MKEKFKSILNINQNLTDFERIKVAAEIAFPKRFRADKAIPTKAGLLFWSHHLNQRSLYVKNVLRNMEKAAEMELASGLVLDQVKKSSALCNEKKVALVEWIYSGISSGEEHKYYLSYSYHFFSNFLERKCEKPILPQMLVKILPRLFPEYSCPKHLNSWRKIKIWSNKLRSAGGHLQHIGSHFNNDRWIKDGRRLFAAADIVYSIFVFFKKNKEPDVVLDWDWCPLCWRPVKENTTGNKLCELHQFNSKDYQSTLRALKRNGVDHKHASFGKIQDKIPIQPFLNIRDAVDSVFLEGFPKGLKYLPHVEKYILKEGSEISLYNLYDCIEVLSPGAVTLFEDSAFDLLKTATVQEHDRHRFLKGLVMDFSKIIFQRAETWLSTTSTVKRGGARKNAGRPPKTPETEEERRKRFKKISKMLRARRHQRKPVE